MCSYCSTAHQKEYLLGDDNDWLLVIVMYSAINRKQSCPIRYDAKIHCQYLMTKRALCIPWLGYDGGAVLVQGATGEPATDSYKVSLVTNCYRSNWGSFSLTTW